jgi:hypothetical protein
MVVDTVTSQVVGKINEASELYHRLILIVAPSGGGKTKVTWHNANGHLEEHGKINQL